MRSILLLLCLAFAGEARRVQKAEARPKSNTATGRANTASEAMQALSSAFTSSKVAAAFVPPVRTSRHFARPLRDSMGQVSMKAKTSKEETSKEEASTSNAIASDDVAGVKTGSESAVSEDAYEPVVVAPRSASTWNPKNLDVSKLPEILGQQIVAKYFKESPAYLTGAHVGDVGFDPLCLTALAKPNMDMDKTLRSAEARNKKMSSMSAEEQAESVAWMRNAELKHGRLAMLAAAGWPIAELKHGAGLASNGRAPSLFNGNLLDFLPALVLIFGGLSFLEFSTKDKIKSGDFGFDPLGFAIEKNPNVPNVGDLEALKLAEMKNGRAAMMAITGFAVQEFLWGSPVVQQTPIFFR